MQELFYISLLAIIAMIFGYSLHYRTLKLEKKNGHEQDQINKLKEELAWTKKKLADQELINDKLRGLILHLENKIRELETKQKQSKY